MARIFDTLRFVKTLNGSPPAMGWFGIQTCVSMYEGQVVRASGTSGSTVKATYEATAILGVNAAGDQTGVITAKIPVYLADNNNVFAGRTITSTTPGGHLFDKVSFAQGTTNHYRLAATAQTDDTACFRVVGWDDEKHNSVRTPVVQMTAATSVWFHVVAVPWTSLLGEAEPTR